MTSNCLKAEQIQFSKKLAKWSIISVLIVVMTAFAAVTFFNVGIEHTQAVTNITNTGVMALSVIVAAYMGNSGLEKMVTAKYQIGSVITKEEDDNSVG